jgi:hypothetical protein
LVPLAELSFASFTHPPGTAPLMAGAATAGALTTTWMLLPLSPTSCASTAITQTLG